MKKAILILLSILLSILQAQLFAQNIRKSKASDTYILTGFVNHDKPITMILTINDENRAIGRYYYHNNKNKYIHVFGNATLNGAIVLEAEIPIEDIEYISKLATEGNNLHNNNTNDTTSIQPDQDISKNEFEQEAENKIITNKFEFIGTFDTINITFDGELINMETEEVFQFVLSKSTSSPINHIETFGIYYYDKFEYKYEYMKLHNMRNIQGINILNRYFEHAATRNEVFILAQIKDYRYSLHGENTNYSFNSSPSFVYADERILSIASSSLEYMGGAHGYGGLIYHIYNIQTGAFLSSSLSNLITNRNNATLVDLLRTKLLENYNKSDFSNFAKITLNDNFCIDASGVHFVYNQLEIAPYALGKIFISFTFDELVPFVNESSPFYYLFK